MLSSNPIAHGMPNDRDANSRSGSIGRELLVSITRKAAAASDATAYPATTARSPKPRGPPSIVAAASEVRRTTAASCPGRSTPRPVDRVVSGAHRIVSRTPTSPIGALMKKIARQPSVEVSSPPTSGPAESATLAPAAHRPTARARSRGSGWVWVSRLSEHGTSTAAPAPCRARAATSTGRLGASPHSADAAVNTTKPAVKTRLAPTRSPSAPAERISAANASVYALTIHCTALTPPPSAAPIDLPATLTTLTSSCTTPKPRLVATRVHRRARRLLSLPPIDVIARIMTAMPTILDDNPFEPGRSDTRVPWNP